eukprot:TRINITY_DN54627_c0_g1_i1.p1 TRINITY_DN54627_c0_g1~~TRINITY_DN54627_c0_g1_i1.p1  ORF type:complete len:293 (-),score=29.74 TRINITY_DN54627_c0_g1_i1:189-998(-)
MSRVSPIVIVATGFKIYINDPSSFGTVLAQCREQLSDDLSWKRPSSRSHASSTSCRSSSLPGSAPMAETFDIFSDNGVESLSSEVSTMSAGVQTADSELCVAGTQTDETLVRKVVACLHDMGMQTDDQSSQTVGSALVGAVTTEMATQSSLSAGDVDQLERDLARIVPKFSALLEAYECLVVRLEASHSMQQTVPQPVEAVVNHDDAVHAHHDCSERITWSDDIPADSLRAHPAHEPQPSAPDQEVEVRVMNHKNCKNKKRMATRSHDD